MVLSFLKYLKEVQFLNPGLRMSSKDLMRVPDREPTHSYVSQSNSKCSPWSRKVDITRSLLEMESRRPHPRGTESESAF